MSNTENNGRITINALSQTDQLGSTDAFTSPVAAAPAVGEVLGPDNGAQDGQYIGPVAEGAAGIPLGLHLLPKDPKAPMLARLRSIAEQAVEYAIACGVAPEEAAKFHSIFLGQFAPCSLITPEAYICCVNESVRQRDRYLGYTTGKMVVRPKGGRESYTIELTPLQEETTQFVFVVATLREGGVRQNGDSDFMSHSLVFPQTKSKMALAIACDLNRQQGDDETGDTFQLVPSRRIYVNQVLNKTTGQTVSVNRLDTINFGTNLANLAAKAAFDGGFPFEKARVNRMSNSERRAQFARGRFGQLPGTTQPSQNGAAGVEDINDPFAVANG